MVFTDLFFILLNRWAATISATHCPIPDLKSDFFASTITTAGASISINLGERLSKK
jgi:hypothetical protein